MRSAAFALVFSLVLLEVLAQVAEVYLQRRQLLPPTTTTSTGTLSDGQLEVVDQICRDTLRYHHISSTLGWDLRPHGVSPLYLTNADAIRAPREYHPQLAPQRRRFIIFGDSYTHGDEVEYDDTWGAQVSRLTHWEVINLGVPGYGPDQAYLRYLDYAARYEATDALFGIMTENPYRLLNTFRPFLNGGTNHPMAKPRYVLDGEGLRLIPPLLQTPRDYCRLREQSEAILPQLGKYDNRYRRYQPPVPIQLFSITRLGWEAQALIRGDGVMEFRGRYEDKARRYNIKAEALVILQHIIRQAIQAAHGHSSRLVVLIFPGPDAIKSHRGYGTWLQSPLIEWLEDEHIPYIDVGPSLIEHPECDPIGYSHYSPCANLLIAQKIAEYYSHPPTPSP